MSVMKFQDLPLAPRDTAWDAAAANKRVREWAGAKDAANEKFARAFFWYDGTKPDTDGNDGYPDAFTAYKLPFADVIEGKLTAVPKGIFGCAAAIQGSRGGVDIPASDRPGVKANIEKYYEKMSKAFGDDNIVAPWKRSSDSTEIERRTVYFDSLEVRAGGDDKPPMIVGHAAVFNTPAQISKNFREQIAPGAFKDAIKADDVRALFNHDANFVLGRNKAGTLRMKEDDKGLAIEIDPPDTQFARDLMVSMKRGDITQMSFGFVAAEQTWDEGEDGSVLRTLKKVQLFDVSPVTYPAYTDTDVAVRALNAFLETKDPEEQTLWQTDIMRRRLELDEVS